MQVTDALTPYASAVGLRCTTVVGGMPIYRQTDALRRGCRARRRHPRPPRRPGRARRLRARRRDDHRPRRGRPDGRHGLHARGHAHCSSNTPQGGQRLLFSATLDGDVDRLVKRFLTNPATPLHRTRPRAPSSTMEHHVLHVEPSDKNGTAAEIGARTGRVIVFVGTRHRADRLTEHLLAQRRTRGGAARRQDPAAAHAHPRPVPHRQGERADRHRRRGPWHPRRRPRPGRQHRPADRRQGLPAPQRTYRPRRRHRHGGHPGRVQPAPRGHPPADGGRREGRVDPGPPRRHRARPDHRRPRPRRASRWPSRGRRRHVRRASTVGAVPSGAAVRPVARRTAPVGAPPGSAPRRPRVLRVPPASRGRPGPRSTPALPAPAPAPRLARRSTPAQPHRPQVVGAAAPPVPGCTASRQVAAPAAPATREHRLNAVPLADPA